MFGGARQLVWRICKAARTLQESILSEARIVSASSVVLCCMVWVPITARVNLTRQHIAHVQAQEFGPRTRLCHCGALTQAAQCSTFASAPASVLHRLSACSPPS